MICAEPTYQFRLPELLQLQHIHVIETDAFRHHAPDEVLPVGKAVARPFAEGQEDLKRTRQLHEM